VLAQPVLLLGCPSMLPGKAPVKLVNRSAAS
jgi:hypothetical protein